MTPSYITHLHFSKRKEKEVCYHCGGFGRNTYYHIGVFTTITKREDCKFCKGKGYLDWVDEILLGVKTN